MAASYEGTSGTAAANDGQHRVEKQWQDLGNASELVVDDSSSDRIDRQQVLRVKNRAEASGGKAA